MALSMRTTAMAAAEASASRTRPGAEAPSTSSASCTIYGGVIAADKPLDVFLAGERAGCLGRVVA